MASTDATLRAFFQASKYAVVGASTNPDKYGYKGQLFLLPASALHCT
jgi:predicted CoA-binding protein